MEMKHCPISNHPIDLINHSAGVFQVACHHSGWMTSLFDDIDEAVDFRATVDVFKLAKDAKREEREGKVRLVNGKWMTRYMTPEELNAFLPASKQQRTQKKATADAENDQSDSGS